MCADVIQLHNLNDLRRFVHQTICDQHALETAAFELCERVLVRRGTPCGMLFCLHGPRSVRLTAVWETEQNTILFYGAAGERLLKTRLMQAPSLSVPVPA